eukprot:jgi/Pico_ML_1/53015/g3637.t1
MIAQILLFVGESISFVAQQKGRGSHKGTVVDGHGSIYDLHATQASTVFALEPPFGLFQRGCVSPVDVVGGTMAPKVAHLAMVPTLCDLETA